MIVIAAGTETLIEADGNPLVFFYEDLADVCSRCSDALMLLAFVLAFAGLLMQVYKGMMQGDLSGIFKNILMTGIIAALIPYYAEFFLEAQVMLGQDLLESLGVDPISMMESFGTSFADAPFDTDDAPSIILGILDPLAWFEYFAQIIGAFIMAVMSIVMYICFWVGFQLQIMAVYLGSACAPIFMAMMLFEPTRDTAVKYHIGMFGILFWPLGWGLGMLFADAVMKTGIPLITFVLGPVSIIPFIGQIISIGGYVILILIVIVWVLVVLFKAPMIVQKAVTTGAQIGMGLVSSTISTAAGVTNAAVQAGAGVATAVGGAAATVATGGAAAPAALGAIGGSVGSIGGAVGSIGKIASSE